MRETEAKQLVMALDGMAAYLETIRNLVISSVEEEAPAAEIVDFEKKSKGKKLLDLIPNDVCLHESTIEAQSFGGNIQMCNACGEQV